MTDMAKAQALFEKAGLTFPHLPKNLRSSLKERGRWLYSTRSIDVSPYILEEYLKEAGAARVDDYAVLAHSGHGVNSYAIQYYLVSGPLRMFLFLGWGGVYMDNEKSAAEIRTCFALMDKIETAAAEKLRSESPLTIVVSDVYDSYWSRYRTCASQRVAGFKTPQRVLGEALDWLVSLQ